MSRPAILLFDDVLVDLLSGLPSKDVSGSGGAEFEAWSCDEREEAMVLEPTTAGGGRALASCIYSAISFFFVVVIVVDRIDKHWWDCRNHVKPSN